MRLINSFLIALGTYSHIPVPEVPWTDENRRYTMCFFPVIGLILYLVWKDQTPLRARSAGKGALIGVIVSVVGSVLLSVLYILLMAGSLRYLY